MSKLFTTAPELWDEISKTAEFQHKEYDMEMLHDIRDRLGLPSDRKMSVLLKEKGISSEALLNAVLCSMKPFSEMLNDLYAMFQKAGAQQSDHNLKIQFDFNRNREVFSTNLDFFRQQAESTKQLIAKVVTTIPIHPYTLVGELARIVNKDYYIDYQELYPEDIKHWLQEYYSRPKGVWPDHTPKKPSTGYTELDEQIGILWKILENSLWKYRNEYFEGLLQNIGDREDAAFWSSEIDNWIGAFVQRICDFCIFFKSSPSEDSQVFATSVANKIKQVLEECPMHRVTVEDAFKSVTDLLNLPFWKKRYELYSVWICSQMLNALPDNDVQYHVKDNTLSFSFSGSHIATIKSYSPPLELWAEVRTYYPSPKGRSRKNHIQPDYTLAIEDAYNADRSVAVVECKQYKKYSRKNFLNAAEDYAGGRPQANVFLVNYGTMNPVLKDSVDGKYRDRIQFFGSIQPYTTETIAFRNALKAAIDQYYKNNFKFKISECFFPNKGCTIRLKWSDLPKDLDLHLIITTDTKKYHVAFNQRGSSDNYPFAELGNDDRDGYGNESITISQLLSAKYDIYVHDYYDTGFISGSITVQIETDGQPEYAISRIEPIEKGKLWHPYTIVAGVISPVNEIVDFSESYFSSR